MTGPRNLGYLRRLFSHAGAPAIYFAEDDLKFGMMGNRPVSKLVTTRLARVCPQLGLTGFDPRKAAADLTTPPRSFAALRGSTE